MLTGRRSFLRILLGSALAVASVHFLKSAFFVRQLTRADEEVLSAFLDTLIPSDETPGASDSGVLQAVRKKTEHDSDYRRLVGNGCLWLDRMAKRSFGKKAFSLLGEHERVYVTEMAARSERESLPWIFFENLRKDAFDFYYGNPETWKALNYFGPPQPDGFPDYYQSSRRRVS